MQPKQTEKTTSGKRLAALLDGAPSAETAEKPKIGHMKGSFTGLSAVAIYVFGCVDLCAFLLGARAVGREFGFEPWAQIGAQIFVGILSLLLIKYMDVNYQIGLDFKGFRYSLFAVVPLVLTAAVKARPLNVDTPFGEAYIVGLAALTAAMWEEAFFRGFGVFLFAKKDGSIAWKTLASLSLLLGAFQLTDLVFDVQRWTTCVSRAIFSIALGVFLLGLYLCTKNLLLSILVHFCFNLIDWVFDTYSDLPLWLGTLPAHITEVAVAVGLVAFGVWLFLKASVRNNQPSAD